MLALGHGHVSAVLILYLWTATVGFGVALFALLPPLTALTVGGVAVLSALILTTGPLRGRRMPPRSASATTAGAPTGPGPDTDDHTDDHAKSGSMAAPRTAR